jgi:hypothetical protein
MTETEIMARLFILQGHTCNGRVTLNPDGKRDPDDKPCDGCSEYLRLTNMLRELRNKDETKTWLLQPDSVLSEPVSP